MNGMNMDKGAGLSLRPPANAAEWQTIHVLRRRALFNDATDTADAGSAYNADHPDDRDADHRVLALFAEDQLLGTLRVDLSHPAWAAFRLVAIDPNRRGRGFGGAMLEMAEAFVTSKGWRQVRLHAKPAAIGFYERHGYRPVGWDEPPRDPNGVNMGKPLC